MASGQVIGRHEVFEYSYRVGPKEARKRIKLVVIQRREQRRKSLIAAGRIFEHAPVRLRLNLHRAKYGDPEVVSGTRHVPITLRRKAKPAPNTIIVHQKIARPPPTVVVRPSPPPKDPNTIMIQPAPPLPPEPLRGIELVDRPVGPEELVQGPPPVVVIPPTQTPSPEPAYIDRPSSRASSVGSTRRPKVKRSNSLTNSFRRFPSLMGLIRRNSGNRGSGSSIVTDDEIRNGEYEYVDVGPRTSQEDVIIEERESQLGSPIAPSARHGPPSVAGSHRAPTIPGSVASGRSGRSRAMSFGSPKNKLIKASPHHVPLPDSHSPSTVTHPVHEREYAEYEPARSVTSRHTADRSILEPEGSLHGPTYTETYLHDSPTSRTRSLNEHEGSVRSHRDGASVKSHNRSVPDLSIHSPSRHSHSAHSHAPSARSARTRHSAEGSPREGRELVLRDVNGARSPSLREASIRDGHSIRDVRAPLSDGDRENEHIQYFERSPTHSRMGSPSIRAPSSRVASPPLHYAGSPSIHPPESYREGSPSLHAPSVRAPSHRVDSPSLHAPSEYAHSRKGSPSIQGHSPPASVIAPSVRSSHPVSSVNGRIIRSKSPLSQSGVSNTSSKRSKASKMSMGPEITPVPMAPPSVISYRSGVSRNGAKSPLSRVASSVVSEEPPQVIIPPTTPSVAGSHRSGRAPSEAAHKTPLPASTYSPSVISQAPTSRSTVPAGPTISRVPSTSGHRSRAPSVAPSNAHRTPLPPSTYAPSVVSETPTRAPSVAPSAAHRTPLPASTYAPTVMSDEVESTIAPPSRVGSVAPSTAYRHPLPPSTYAPTVMSDEVESTIAPPSRVGSVAPSAAYRHPLPPSTYAPSEAPTRAPSSAAHRTPLPASTYAPTVMSDDFESTIAPPSRIGSMAPSTAHRTPLPPSTYAPSEAPTRTHSSAAYRAPLPPSTYAPTVMSDDVESTIAPPSRIGSVAPSAAHRTPLPPSNYAPRVPLPESVVGSPVTRAPSAADTHRTGSLRRTPSALGTPRIPPSVIGSQRVPPSITGSAPSRHTPPPESAPSDIAPESESHGGKALRAQARLEGDKMEMAFAASKRAHEEGDKARAKQLSDLGKDHQEKMHKLHQEAANQIFKEKNEGLPANEIDLHGLHVKEAISRLSKYLREAPVAGQTMVRVITGKGIHSSGEPQIIPAVEDSLRSKGLRHHTDPHNPGIVVVELGPRSPVSD
ncbi:hypothetical protein OPQ81_003566 [Rhizoctonia solani]|nr:hypothetical protein OPQ81_003566 [Rhizoctonia solani]